MAKKFDPTRCVVCGEKLVQDYTQTSQRHVKINAGSHCPNCKLKYVTNLGVILNTTPEGG